MKLLLMHENVKIDSSVKTQFYLNYVLILLSRIAFDFIKVLLRTFSIYS